MFIISACLAGVQCKYNGGDNNSPLGEQLLQEGRAIPLCPEVLGGLSTPRNPCEIQCVNGGKSVVEASGVDHTLAFMEGARKTVEVCKTLGIRLAILQDRSPSCGKGQIYSGEFDGKLIEGNGLAVDLLEAEGIKVVTINDFIDFTQVEISKMCQEDAEAIVEWSYPTPYEIYNMNGDYGSIGELLVGDYYSVTFKGNLVGFYCYGKSSQVPSIASKDLYQEEALDIGLGLRPDLCGLGYGFGFMKAGLMYGLGQRKPRSFRLTVASFNKRGLALYEQLGFKIHGTFIRERDQEEFIVMKRGCDV